jgi:hypothetical protein
VNIELRDEILRPYIPNALGKSLSRFRGLPLDVLETLVAHGFVALGKWNRCAGVDSLFLPFLRRHPEFTAHGYAVHKDRSDCRITIEGVECEKPMTDETVSDFTNAFSLHAEEARVSPSYAYCRFD